MKRLHRMMALALAGVMTLGLAGCGKDGGSSPETGNQQAGNTLAQELGFGYLSEFERPDVNLNWVGSSIVCGDTLYIQGDYYDESSLRNSTRIYGLDMTDGSTTEIPIPELTHTDTTDEYIQSVRVSPDATYYLMATYSHTFVPMDEGSDAILFNESAETSEPMPEPATAEEPEATAEEGDTMETPAESEEPTEERNQGDDTSAEEESATELPAESPAMDEEVYTIYKCDMNGTVLSKIDLSDAAKESRESEGYFGVNQIALGQDETVMVVSGGVIYCYGLDGTRKENIDVPTDYIADLVTNSDGSNYIVYYTETGDECISRIENGKASEPVAVSVDNGLRGGSIYPGSGTQALLSDGISLYSIDTSTGATQKILNWLDSDINASNLQTVAALDEYTIVAMLSKWQRSGDPVYEIVKLKKTPAEDLPVRTILTLGSEYVDNDIADLLIDFNKNNEEYRITMKDYSAYNTEEDYLAGRKQLDLDIISGNAPDLIYMTSGRQQRYIKKGVLANLTELMEQDGDLTMEQILDAPTKSYMSNGALYGIPTTFSIRTLAASTKIVGDRTSWTLAEMAQVIGNLPDDTVVSRYETQDVFLQNMFSNNLTKFVDYGNATCNFDNDEFRQILEMSKQLPKEFDSESYDNYTDSMIYISDEEMLQSGEMLLSQQGIYEAIDVKRLYNLYNESNGITPIGYPADEGGGFILATDGAFGISESCAHKDIAWDFIKSLFSEEAQKNAWGFPILSTSFDARMQEAMEQSFYMDGEEKVYYDDSYYIGDVEYTMAPLTEVQVAAFRQAIDNAQVGGYYDSDILTILQEEAAAYFAGDKTAEQVSALIQNRVSIYLGENS